MYFINTKLQVNKMESIKNKLLKIEQLYEIINDYISKISVYVNDDIKNYLIDISKHLVEIKKIDMTDKLESIFHIWHIMELILSNISNIIQNLQIIIDSTIITNKSISETKIINNLYNNIILLYNKFTKEIDINDKKTVKNLDDISYKKLKWDKTNVMENVDMITDLVKLYPCAMQLYATIIQNTLNYCMRYGINVCDKIINIVEDVKDYIMLDNVPNKLGSNFLYKSNPHIKTFGLTPLGPSDTLYNITLLIKSIKPAKKVTNLASIAKDSGVCIILINNVIHEH